MSLLNELLEKIQNFSPEERREALEGAFQARQRKIWIPNPGPQTDAYECEADELYFGGEVGGGKSDLLIGLALTAHKRSLLLRRINDDARALMQRAIEIVGHTNGLNKTLMEWDMRERRIDFGGCQLEDDKLRYKGIPHDLIGFDEGADFTLSQFEFIKIWLRSADPKQRCRIVVASNPPTTAEGLWLVQRWAPWLDKKHPNPAKPGEIRWYFKFDGEEREKEVDGPGPYPTTDPGTGKTEMVRATSRTFIRSRLEDNPDYAKSGYRDRIHLLPEDLRKVYRGGDYEVGMRDQPNQVIPTAWVTAAQQRWKSKPPPNVPMCAMGVDCSGGGTDPMIIASRYDTWFAPLIEVPGKTIPEDSAGKYCSAIIISNRRDRAVVIPDMGGGYGSAIFEALRENDVTTIPYKGSEKSLNRTKDRQHGFFNVRSEAIWKFREALDPNQEWGSPIALPPDQVLLADLTAPTFEIGPHGIKIENKEDIVKRLGRSTDRGDAVVMSWWAGPTLVGGGEMKPRSGSRKPEVIVALKRRRR